MTSSISLSIDLVQPGSKFHDQEFGSFAALNAWMATQDPAAPRDEVKFGTGPYVLDQAVGLYSGHRLLAHHLPAREFGSGCVWKAGPGLTSFFSQQNNVQGYPMSGRVVRDFGVQGIEFTGSLPVLPPHNLKTETEPGNAVYYIEFRDCGFVGVPIINGWADGLHLAGATHVNSGTQTVVTIGGSIFTFGGAGAPMSYMDSANAAWMAAGLPFINVFSTQWVIGSVEISARQTSYGLLVSGGANGRCIGTFFDAPDTNPTQGAAVRVTGGTSLGFTGCSFHNNHGISATASTSDIVIEGNIFRNCPEILNLGPGFTGRALLGLNALDNSAHSVKVTALSQIICNDPRITITDQSGNLLRAATA